MGKSIYLWKWLQSPRWLIPKVAQPHREFHTHGFSHGYTCSEPWVTRTRALPYVPLTGASSRSSSLNADAVT